MKISDDGIHFIKHFYKLNRTPHHSVQLVPVIGYGLWIYPDTGQAVTLQDPDITTDQALHHLRLHLEQHIGAHLATLVQVPISQNQIDALYSFAYRIGIDAFRTSKVLQFINNRLEESRIYQEMQQYTRLNGRIDDGLIIRGVKEAHLFIRKS